MGCKESSAGFIEGDEKGHRRKKKEEKPRVIQSHAES
jgi:hypothetical protein